MISQLVVKLHGHWRFICITFMYYWVSGITNSDQLVAFTGSTGGPTSPQVDVASRCVVRPTTILLLKREDGKHNAASLIEALTVQLTLSGVLGKLLLLSCNIYPVSQYVTK